MKLIFFFRWDLEEEKKKYGHLLSEDDLKYQKKKIEDISQKYIVNDNFRELEEEIVKPK